MRKVESPIIHCTVYTALTSSAEDMPIGRSSLAIPPRRVLYLDRGRKEREKGVGTVRSKRKGNEKGKKGGRERRRSHIFEHMA